MASPSSQQADRILNLLHALLRSEGLTREEIYSQVPAYQLVPSEDAKRRVFERDMIHLRASPFVIEVVHSRSALYKASIGGVHENME